MKGVICNFIISLVLTFICAQFTVGATVTELVEVGIIIVPCFMVVIWISSAIFLSKGYADRVAEKKRRKRDRRSRRDSYYKDEFEEYQHWNITRKR